jgi:3-deoxy-D-manno-octulosonate 8-phosphate phosphatase (KDO 8-P phosphatase)
MTAGADAVLERARGLKLMAFDVDGVLTDGVLYLTDDGAEMKAFHTLDGLGLKLLAGAGVELALITGRSSRVVAKRAAELGIARLFQGADDKLAVLERLRAELGLAFGACGYMGDDLPDLPLLARCGFAATVPDAQDAVRARAHYVSRRPGGRGAVREVCEVILAARGALDRAVDGYLP